MAENDIKDRKAMGVFGSKKNSEIVSKPTAVDSSGKVKSRSNSPDFMPISVAKDCQACGSFAPGLLT